MFRSQCAHAGVRGLRADRHHAVSQQKQVQGLRHHELCECRPPRARDFPNPHDGEMKSDPAEKLYETPTKKTMILMKWVDWDISELQLITLSYNKNN